MKKRIKAPAKINLCLDVVGKTNDGYHNLKMIMQTISLFDIIDVEIKKATSDYRKDIVLNCNYSFIPTDDRNLIVKIIKFFYENYSIIDNFFINLNKMIPTCGGLGGGSSDAASTILLINEYYKLNLSKSKLIEIGLMFGADIPFFIEKGIAICEGKGEKITKLNDFNNYYILLATPNVRVSTKDIFDQYDNTYNDIHTNYDKEFDICVESINNRNLIELSNSIFNDLEQVTERHVPEIATFKEKMLEMGALNAKMSGSGPSVYGLYKSYFKALNCKKVLKNMYKDAVVYVAKPI